MKPASVRPYESTQLPQVADLLTEARRERRRQSPLLPPALDDPAAARTLLQDKSDGVVALSADGVVCGFLFPERREDRYWGDSLVVDVDMWGLSADAGTAAMAQLYGVGSAPLTDGISEHVVYCPANDRRLLDGWFHLGFGMEQAYAAVRLEEIDSGEAGQEGLQIRRARPGDEDALVSLSHLVLTMQAEPPVWAGLTTAYLAELRKGFAELPTDPDATTLLAFQAGRAVGYQVWAPMEGPGVDGVTDGAVELAAAATVPEKRGRGVGSALTAAGVAAAQDAGYAVCFTDWRTANPLASTFWLARGFRPYLYRLVRRLAPRGGGGNG